MTSRSIVFAAAAQNDDKNAAKPGGANLTMPKIAKVKGDALQRQTMGHSTSWKPIWKERDDGISETRATVKVTMTRREWATLRRFARDENVDRAEALEAVFRIGLAEISDTYDPSRGSAAAAIFGTKPRRSL